MPARTGPAIGGTITPLQSVRNYMLRFLKNRTAERGDSLQYAGLGHLEEGVMAVLWERGESSVRDVAQKLQQRVGPFLAGFEMQCLAVDAAMLAKLASDDDRVGV